MKEEGFNFKLNAKDCARENLEKRDWRRVNELYAKNKIYYIIEDGLIVGLGSDE